MKNKNKNQQLRNILQVYHKKVPSSNHINTTHEFLNMLFQKVNVHLDCFNNTVKDLESLNDAYYIELSNLIQEERMKMKKTLKKETQKYINQLKARKIQISEYISKYKINQNNSQISQQHYYELIKIKAPQFHLEFFKLKEVQNFLSTLRPQILFAQHNQTLQRLNDQTLKKTQINQQKVRQQNADILDLTCNEQFCWNENAKLGKKHEIVSEIIFEEPSSCQNSLLTNQIL